MMSVMKRIISVFCLMFIGVMAMAQSITVKGTVKDSKDEPLIGVAVMLEGNTRVGTVTDSDGKYQLTMPAGKNQKIVFSSIGYKELMVEVAGRGVIDVTLEGSINSSGEQFDYTNFENINAVEKATNEYVESLMNEYLYLISKDYNSDIGGFGGKLALKFMTTDEFNKVHWSEIFKDSYFDVEVTTSITSSHLFHKE